MWLVKEKFNFSIAVYISNLIKLKRHNCIKICECFCVVCYALTLCVFLFPSFLSFWLNSFSLFAFVCQRFNSLVCVTWRCYDVYAGFVCQLKQLMQIYNVDDVVIVDVKIVHRFCDKVFCRCCCCYFSHCNGWWRYCCLHRTHFSTNDFSFFYEQSMTYFRYASILFFFPLSISQRRHWFKSRWMLLVMPSQHSSSNDENICLLIWSECDCVNVFFPRYFTVLIFVNDLDFNAYFIIFTLGLLYMWFVVCLWQSAHITFAFNCRCSGESCSIQLDYFSFFSSLFHL